VHPLVPGDVNTINSLLANTSFYCSYRALFGLLLDLYFTDAFCARPFHNPEANVKIEVTREISIQLQDTRSTNEQIWCLRVWVWLVEGGEVTNGFLCDVDHYKIAFICTPIEILARLERGSFSFSIGEGQINNSNYNFRVNQN
jgi:hypothetical protein